MSDRLSGPKYEAIDRDPQPADQLVLWLPVFMCFGIGLYFLLPSEPPIAAILSILAAICIGVAVSWRWHVSAVWRWSVTALFAAAFGFLLIQNHSTRLLETHRLLDQSLWNRSITGQIASFERVGAGWRVVLSQSSVDGGKSHYNFRLTIRTRGFMPEEGGRLTVKGSVMAPSAPLVPNSFDFRRHAFFRGISGYGYATKIIDYVPPTKEYQKNRLELYRDWLTEKVYAVLEQPEAGIVTALLNGQRAGITKKSTTMLQQSGLQHVISISGLHVSLLAITIFFSIRLLLALNMRLALVWPIKKIAAFCALIGIVFYLLIVGSSPPTLRAVLVTGAALCAVMLDREPIQMRVVALAAMAILILQPDSLIDIGFQMSFAAVIALVAFYQYTRGFWTHAFWKNNIVYKVILLGIGTVATSIIATIATAPLVLMYFQQVPLLSMLANVLAAPAISFLIMPGTFLAYLLTPFPVLGDLAIHMMGIGTDIMLQVAHFVAGLPSAVWRIPPLPFYSVILIMLGLWMIVSLPRHWRYAGAACVMLACTGLPFAPKPDIYLTSDRVVLYPEPDSDILYVEGKLPKFNRDLVLQWTAKSKVEPLPCTQDICDLTIKGKTIRFVRTVPALAHACDGKADLVVTRYYLDRACADMPVLDRNKLKRKGGHAAFIERSGIRFETVYSKTDKARPWQLAKIGFWYQSPANKAGK